jgi:hypothetical protein
MSTTKKYLLVFLPLVCFAACGPSQYVLTPKGDTANIQTKTGLRFTGELLCIQDSSVYLIRGEPESKVIRLPILDVRHIEIEGYANRRWVPSVIFFQAIPTILITVVASNVDVDLTEPVLLIFGVPTLITYVAFEASTPAKPQSDNPKSIEDIQGLRKYTRFPQGLTDTQFQMILQRHNQTSTEVLH